MNPKVALWVLLVTISLDQAVASPSSQPLSPSDSLRNERIVLKYLWPALDYGEKVGRIYYAAACQSDDNLARSFPKLDVQPPPSGKSGLAAIREIFKKVHSASVTEPEAGVINVRIGLVPNAILQARILSLNLSPAEQYNTWLAIGAIQNAPEVRSMMHKHSIRTPARPLNIQITKPTAGLPHLPGLITNITFDQALNMVAKTFGGVVIYEFCTPPAQYEIDFANAGDIYATTRP